MKKWIVVGILIIAAVTAVGFWLAHNNAQTLQDSNRGLPISAEIGGFFVRVADDMHERELGLSYFKTLPADQGMLFLFDQSGRYPFWMKGMNFPLDIIWLKKVSGDTFQVVYVAENVGPDTYPQSFDPGADADAVLEINHFRAKSNQIFVGGPNLVLQNHVTTRKPVLQ